MRKAALVLSVALLGGCGGNLQKVHKRAYIAGAVTKNVVEESHQIYSKQLNKKADECEASAKSEKEFDECLGPYAHNDDVVLALTTYKQAAEVLFNALKNPDSPKEQLAELRDRVMKAALTLLDKMPDGSPAKQQLESILGS
jgi:hypothetical protein